MKLLLLVAVSVWTTLTLLSLVLLLPTRLMQIYDVLDCDRAIAIDWLRLSCFGIRLTLHEDA